LNRPNFFIVGAPKCGTTALYHYLAEHPSIFMPPLKEPHYFADDLPHMQAVATETDYLALFKPAGPEHIAVGEASVMYLYSSVALRRIHEFAPDAKIVAMLRHPVEMVYSFHSQLLYGFHEEEKDFSKAWELQEARRQGQHLPARPTDAALLQYKALGELGRQVETLLNTFPAEQVKLILFDDFKRSPKAIYDEVLAFLEVPNDGRTEFPKINENKTYRAPRMARLVIALEAVQRRIKRVLGLKPGRKRRFLKYLNALHFLRRLNTKNTARPPLPDELRERLVREFRPDIERLSRLLGRDLHHWLR